MVLESTRGSFHSPKDQLLQRVKEDMPELPEDEAISCNLAHSFFQSFRIEMSASAIYTLKLKVFDEFLSRSPHV